MGKEIVVVVHLFVFLSVPNEMLFQFCFDPVVWLMMILFEFLLDVMVWSVACIVPQSDYVKQNMYIVFHYNQQFQVL